MGGTQGDRERGAAAVELALLTPVLVVVMVFVVGLGRLVTARGDVEAAARDGARAASLVRDPRAAEAAARAGASRSLTGHGARCRALEVVAHTGGWTSSRTVAVEVSCTVELSDVALLGLPGTKQLRARFVVPLDAYRGEAR